MSDLSIEEKLACVLTRIDELEHEQDSIMCDYNPSRAPFVKKAGQRHGQWATKDHSTVQSFTIVAPLGHSFVGNYADLSPTKDDIVMYFTYIVISIS